MWIYHGTAMSPVKPILIFEVGFFDLRNSRYLPFKAVNFVIL